MEKRYNFLILLASAVLLFGAAAQAQPTLPKVWSDTAGVAWFPLTDAVRGIAYNPTTKHAIVASRGVSAFVILNAATGDSIGRLDTTGFSTWSGTYKFNRIGISADGRIYTSNLVTAVNKGASALKIWTWANETAKPTLAFSDSIAGPRLGDAFTVVGSGANTYIYISGTSTTKAVNVLKRSNDSLMTLYKTIPVDYAGMHSIAPVTNGFGSFWVNMTGIEATLFDTTGTKLDFVPGSIVASSEAGAKYFEMFGKKFLITGFGNVAEQFVRVVDITKGGANAFVAAKASLGKKANLNGTGDINWNAADSTLYVVSTNNSVGAYKFKTPSVRITFMANTATVPDTLKPTSVVQVRGGSVSLTWGNDTPAQMKNNGGGDYWQYTGVFPQGETFGYKYVTKASASSAVDGWENDLANGNRDMTVGNNDTTIALEYVNATSVKQPQFWRPYTPSTDSVAVMFRVNVQNEETFNKATMKMGVRGGLAPLDWGKDFVLTQEPQHGNTGSISYDASNFYSGVLKFPKSAAGSNAEYKFVITNADGSVTWEDNIVGVSGNRAFVLPSQDTTLTWKYWRNVGTKPPTGNDTAFVSFTANLASAVARNSFKLGDTVLVQYGWGNSAKTVGTDTLRRQGITGYIYKSTANLQVLGTKIDAAGTIPLYYSYYLVRGATTLKEVYYNFNFSGSDNSLAERRSVAVTSKTLAAVDTSVILSNSYRQPFWRNQKVLARDVAVTVTCDLRPAYWQVSKGDTLNDIQGAFNVYKSVRDSIWKWGVYINGPMSANTASPANWQTWGSALIADTTRKMYDDGTHGDKTSGDHIYTRIIKLYKDSTNYTNNTVGQEFKFGLRGGDNEGGKGGFGNNHIENIDDSQPTPTLDNQFGSINPKFYNNWNYDTHAAVTEVAALDGVVPGVYALEQNYPNPFNPTTTIRYQLPVSGKVLLVVYNVLGQEVMTLVNQTQNAGAYSASFDASRLSSGMYLYRIEAGSFNAVKKMLLVK